MRFAPPCFWVRYFTPVLLAMIFTGNAVCQTVPAYVERLERTSTPSEFDAVFGAMIDDMRSEKIAFQGKDIEAIVAVAAKKSFSDRILPAVYGWAGTMFGQGKMNEALRYFMESANLYAKQKNKNAEALSYFEMALIHHRAQNYAEAEAYFTKTLETGKDSLNHRVIINSLNGLALIEREQKKYDRAIVGFRRALHIAVTNKDTAWMAILAGNIGSIYQRQDQYDSSLYFYLQNLSLIKRTQEFENEIETYVQIGKTLNGQKNYRKALLYLDSARYIIASRKIKFNDFFNPTPEINQGYASAYWGLGNYKQAYEYEAAFNRAAQERQEQINGRNLQQMQTLYSYNQQQNEFDLLQQVNDANVATIRQQRYTQIAFGAIILLLSALTFIGFRTGKQRKKMNNDLVASNTELERLNTVKDKLFSVISHDLRGPLNNLQSMLDLYKTGSLDRNDFDRLVAKLNHQIKASGDTLENLLEWSKGQLNETHMHRESVHPAAVVAHVAHQFMENLDEKKITCEQEVHAEHEVWADKNQLQIVIRNLLSNAIKFTPPGGTIRIHSERNESDVEISVEDNGTGMTPEETRQLFQPGGNFTRPGTHLEKGTGIGLLICKEIVQSHGGEINVISEKGTGTTFTFTLPRSVLKA